MLGSAVHAACYQLAATMSHHWCMHQQCSMHPPAVTCHIIIPGACHYSGLSSGRGVHVLGNQVSLFISHHSQPCMHRAWYSVSSMQNSFQMYCDGDAWACRKAYLARAVTATACVNLICAVNNNQYTMLTWQPCWVQLVQHYYSCMTHDRNMQVS